MPNKVTFADSHISSLFVVIFCMSILTVVCLNAWIYEDAFITFRTVSNYIDGYGLRYNIDERVLTYTHPLWMLLHIPFYAITKNIFLVSLVLCISCSVGACVVILLQLRKKLDVFLLGGCFVIPLLSSKTFQIFSTSGLESPLVYLLFSIFCMYLLSVREKLNWLAISLAISLCATTRLDTLLLFLPVFTYLLFSHRNSLPWRKLFIGFSPLILWELFSIFYYGSAFPNTKYSKLDSGLPVLKYYIEPGWDYWLHFMHIDLLSSTIVITGIIVTGIWFRQWTRNRENTQAAMLASLGMGLFLYVVYVIRIGGDYIGMRMWAVSFFTYLVYINYSIYCAGHIISKKLLNSFIVALILIFAIHNAFLPGHKPFPNEIKRYSLITTHYNEEHTFSYAWNLIKNNAIKYDLMTTAAKRMNEEYRRVNRPILQRTCCLGIQGYYSNRRIVLSDTYAISDAFLARLPAQTVSRRSRRVGHFDRVLPKGYELARMQGDYSMMDPDLAEYYKKVRLITMGPLFSWERMQTIVAFNFGFYNEYRDAYLDKFVGEITVSVRRQPINSECPKTSFIIRGALK